MNGGWQKALTSGRWMLGSFDIFALVSNIDSDPVYGATESKLNKT